MGVCDGRRGPRCMGARAPQPRRVGTRGALSAALLYRASTAYCPVYAAAGISTAEDGDTKRALSGPGGADRRVCDYRESLRVGCLCLLADARQPATCDGAPGVGDSARRGALAVGGCGAARHDRRVGCRDHQRGSRQSDRMALRARVHGCHGRFRQLRAGGSGTNVRVRLQYLPPGGKFGSRVAWVFGEEPSVQIEKDLRRFKQIQR